MTTSLLDTLGVTVPSTVPTHWYNLAADLPDAVPAGPAPGDPGAARPRTTWRRCSRWR